ncbi:thiolase family protein [Streptomyces albipurpureus]|uniref:Thiolase family protein n=1 Tax=Streptomyces albipurpureus TaxID=2897419 RepID=A0ABT0UYU3_9ACTN|nr:thiolase family protein [Streptomyces sp. CWNU-1]MCM2393742.1 thiolase family protein [Streptomyces sp. CWNU-1]
MNTRASSGSTGRAEGHPGRGKATGAARADPATAIIGAGMTPFGKHLGRSLKSLGAEAVRSALGDAGLTTADLDMAFVSNAMASVVTGQVSVVGQTVLRDMGMTGIPVFNIDNACAGSSSALALACQAIRSGEAETVLVLGVEKLYSEDRTAAYRALNGAADIDVLHASGIDPGRESVFIKAVYPPRLAAYAARYGLTAETLAGISVKNRRHAGHNPLAQYREPLTLAQVLASRSVAEPVRALMCAPIGDGAAAVVVTGERQLTASHSPVWVRACAIGMGGAADGRSALSRVADRAYARAGMGPESIHVAEVHDSISFNELLAYEELGFCGPGEGCDLVADSATALGGTLPVNTSGGLESRGHPVAATGLAQVTELVAQLRGDAGARQVPGARWALAENAGGLALDDTAALAVTILEGQGGT